MEPLNNDSEMKVRIISGAVMAVMVLSALALGGMFFIALIMIAALQMIREWDTITFNENILWRMAGLVYVAIPCACLLWLRREADGASLVLTLFLIVWATDIGAYFAGRLIGGPKLAPAISPNKTWAGLGGGALAAALVAAIATSFSPVPSGVGNAIVLGLALAVLGQAGDLFESWLKRRADVKDSGTLIPGHGGLLDRVDGLILTTPVFALLVWSA
ncbi:MAG: phosphatidate cytidylyltransferase [Alphaproteobacteria bacterium]|nr:phosphatidate cytidylyltransferase [Alphaproteobacteria bacterium]